MGEITEELVDKEKLEGEEKDKQLPLDKTMLLDTAKLFFCFILF